MMMPEGENRHVAVNKVAAAHGRLVLHTRDHLMPLSVAISNVELVEVIGVDRAHKTSLKMVSGDKLFIVGDANDDSLTDDDRERLVIWCAVYVQMCMDPKTTSETRFDEALGRTNAVTNQHANRFRKRRGEQPR